MDIKVGSTVKISGVAYTVLAVHSERHNYYFVQADGGQPFWASGDSFEYTLSEMASMGHFGSRNGGKSIQIPTRDPDPGTESWQVRVR